MSLMNGNDSHPAACQARELLRNYMPVPLSVADTLPSANRYDTKFVLSHSQLIAALRFMDGDYSALDIDGIRVHRYRTLYFDTPGFDLYLRHHSGARNRFKVRSRHYVDSDRSFLEVKRKAGKNRTVKARKETASTVTELTMEAMGFVESQALTGTGDLEPKLWNEFDRITLLGNSSAERVTLDLRIGFSSGAERQSMPGLAVAELKQASIDRTSPFFRHMRSIGSRPARFSKYCVAAQLLHPQLKRNRFRKSLRAVEKLAEGAVHAA